MNVNALRDVAVADDEGEPGLARLRDLGVRRRSQHEDLRRPAGRPARSSASATVATQRAVAPASSAASAQSTAP